MTEPRPGTEAGGAFPDGPPGMPLWVKAAAVLVGLLLVVYLVLVLTGHGGGHGPGMHSSSGPSSTGEAALLPAGR